MPVACFVAKFCADRYLNAQHLGGQAGQIAQQYVVLLPLPYKVAQTLRLSHFLFFLALKIFVFQNQISEHQF